jgi:hypothetical protein
MAHRLAAGPERLRPGAFALVGFGFSGFDFPLPLDGDQVPALFGLTLEILYSQRT